MATTYNNAQIGVVDASGNLNVIYPITKATNVAYKSTSVDAKLTSLQSAVDTLNSNLGSLDKKVDELSPSVFISVAQDGSGDFKTLNEAFNSVEEGSNVYILLMEGEYNEIINLSCRFNFVSIIGSNRDKCVIINKTGMYKNSPFLISGNFTLENITFEMTLSNTGSWTPTYDHSDVNNTFPGYALHIDDNSYNRTEYAKGFIRNCIVYSEAFPAVGMGVNNKQYIEFNSCQFIRKCTNTNYQHDDWKGAFYCHSSNDSSAVSQNLTLINNIFQCNYGYSAHIRADLGTPTEFSLCSIGNTFYSNTDGADSCYYVKSTSLLDSKSNSNTANNLNSIQGSSSGESSAWNLVYENYNLSENTNYALSKSIPSTANEVMVMMGLTQNSSMITYWRETLVIPYSEIKYGNHMTLFNSTTEYRNIMFSIATKSFNTSTFSSSGWNGLNIGVKVYYR